MQKKYRIAILGIGGVGGFIGGKLAAAYSHSADVEIVFIARGANAQAIKEHGLKLITSLGEEVVHPDAVTGVGAVEGGIDLLICCTKTYDLEDSIVALSPSITAGTLVLPLLNGVDSTEKIQSIVPAAKVLHGCIYLVSKLTAPGVVQQRGDFYTLHFGGDKMWTTEITKVSDLFKQANINAVPEDNIRDKVWSKFSFISPVATYTSAHNISMGKILESSAHTAAIKKLMAELLALAGAMSIDLPPDTMEKNFAVMGKLPYETTSSMQADFANNKPTELETLTGFVTRKATEHALQVATYTELYQLLHDRA